MEGTWSCLSADQEGQPNSIGMPLKNINQPIEWFWVQRVISTDFEWESQDRHATH